MARWPLRVHSPGNGGGLPLWQLCRRAPASPAYNAWRSRPTAPMCDDQTPRPLSAPSPKVDPSAAGSRWSEYPPQVQEFRGFITGTPRTLAGAFSAPPRRSRWDDLRLRLTSPTTSICCRASARWCGSARSTRATTPERLGVSSRPLEREPPSDQVRRGADRPGGTPSARAAGFPPRAAPPPPPRRRRASAHSALFHRLAPVAPPPRFRRARGAAADGIHRPPASHSRRGRPAAAAPPPDRAARQHASRPPDSDSSRPTRPAAVARACLACAGRAREVLPTSATLCRASLRTFDLGAAATEAP